MKTLIAIAIAGATAFATAGTASAACSPNAITSKPAQAAPGGDQQAAKEAKGIAEDGQHTPLETDPNAPGVTEAKGGVTTNTQKAEAEIAAATDKTTTASTTNGTATASAGQDVACPQ